MGFHTILFIDFFYVTLIKWNKYNIYKQKCSELFLNTAKGLTGKSKLHQRLKVSSK
jgi:hypothetical protein